MENRIAGKLQGTIETVKNPGVNQITNLRVQEMGVDWIPGYARKFEVYDNNVSDGPEQQFIQGVKRVRPLRHEKHQGTPEL